jgi:MoaA/NifB/PqqE/SkfB family radical SAM enzyme
VPEARRRNGLRQVNTQEDKRGASNYEGRVGFAVGTGRCGTKFLAQVARLENAIASVHERNPLNEAFHRYCKWYELNVDSEGFLHTKQKEIDTDLKTHRYSFESSAQLSLSIPELFHRFGAKFLLIVRRPEDVVNSYIRKGWYSQPVVRSDPRRALGYQECKLFHHFLGRIVPSGEKFADWDRMTAVGKLGWFWNELNARVMEQFSELPETHWRVVKLEELSYERYLGIAAFLGFQSQVERDVYNGIARSRPNTLSGLRAIESWSVTEIAEFEAQVAPTAHKLGYEYRVERLKGRSEKRKPASHEKNTYRFEETAEFGRFGKPAAAVSRGAGERAEPAISRELIESNDNTTKKRPLASALAECFKIRIQRGVFDSMIRRPKGELVTRYAPETVLKHIPARFLKLNLEWPASIIVEPTNVCNLACPVCTTHLGMERPKGFMAFDTFKFIIDDIKGKVGHIAMNFAGEPTLHRDLWRFVRYAQDNGVKVLVSTNSMLLDRQIDQILESDLDRIVVCLDGTSKEVHETYRRRSDFERIRDGIALLCREKRKRGLVKPHINLQFLVMAHNEHQMGQIRALGKELGVDSLSLKTMSLGSIGRSEQEQLELARQWLPKNAKYNRYYVSGGRLHRKEVPKMCQWYKSGVIYWNGDVGVCCYDFLGRIAGNNILKEGGFSKLYKSTKWAQIQKQTMLKGFELCTRCNLTTFAGETILYDENH